MTSSLLTMMDRHGDSQGHPQARRSPQHQNGDVFSSQSEPNLALREQASPMRPPPGMSGVPGRELAGSKSPQMGGGGGYFVGGYDQPPPPWGG
ncbi:hypothetical protein ACHAXT_010046 [Thalassiosira profunda]